MNLQPHRVQKPLVLIVSRHRLDVAAEALGPLGHAALVPTAAWLRGGLGDGGVSGAAGHGAGGAAQQQHSTGLPHLAEQVQDRASQRGGETKSTSKVPVYSPQGSLPDSAVCI